MIPIKAKVLAIGNLNIKPEEGTQIDKCLIRELPAEGENVYDMIYCMNTLPELERDEVPGALTRMMELIRPFGEIQIMIPSAEYAAKRIYKYHEITDPILQVVPYTMLYGTKANPFRACYTLLAMRDILESVGLILRRTEAGLMEVRKPDTNESTQIPMHVLVATKNE